MYERSVLVHKNLHSKDKIKDRECFDAKFTDRDRIRDLKRLLSSPMEVIEEPGTGLRSVFQL